jgi:serine/threonine-protein kinase
MEYVHGASLSRLLRLSAERERPIQPDVTASIIAGVSHGLHAAHTATDRSEQPLSIVHRDVSPQNIMVGSDGVPRVFDFGIAKAVGRLQTTREGQIKGKLAYMAPEQLAGDTVDATTDVYATCVVFWEALAGRRMFKAEHEAQLLAQVLGGVTAPPSVHNPEVPTVLDELVMTGLHLDSAKRFGSARELAKAIEQAITLVTASEIGEWVQDLASDSLGELAQRVAEVESRTDIMTLGDDELPSSISGPQSAQADDQDEIPTRLGEVPTSSREAAELPTGSSQLSSITVAKAVEQPPPPNRRLLLGVAVASLVIGGATAAFTTRGVESTDGASTASGATDIVPEASATSIAASASVALPSPSSMSSASIVGLPAETSSVAPSSRPPSSAAGPTTARPTSPKVASPMPSQSAAPADDCAMPYTLDADGIRIPKPKCMK